ncbi:ATP-binding protein [Paraburkholderia sp. DGU8]|uniref:ATP-binding protein n=1 Tax=Paraburkholderia sp. DGU8 TaxID=3161997 RepID=UPI003465C963
MNDLRPTQPAILYVDDEELARKYFGRAVGGDYEVLLAQSSDEAMAMLQQHGDRLAVLVTDFRMPGRDGGELLRQVAQQFPHIVRILVTAYADVDVLLQMVNNGDVYSILEKPLRPASVRETLRMAIERHRGPGLQNQRLMAKDAALASETHELNAPSAATGVNASSIENRGDVQQDSPLLATAAGESLRERAQHCMAAASAFWRSVHNGQRKMAGGDAQSEITAHALISAFLETYPFTTAQRSWVHTEIIGDFPVVVQPDCVALVLSCLLSNSLRALADVRAASVRFTVIAEPNPRIRICDNGPGIPPEMKARLLTDPLTTDAQSGVSGSGLILCKRVMQSWGGGLEIESDSGVGTTVMLHFPHIKG